MKTFSLLAARPATIPATAAWYIADLSEARGRQELFTKQAPQKLKVLREHAVIESAVSSNRLEGVQFELGRVEPVLLGRATFRARDEEESRDYRDARRLIHDLGSELPLTRKGGKTEAVEVAVRAPTSEFTLAELERRCPGVSWDLLRKVLRDLKAAGEVECLGRVPSARWSREGTTTRKR